MLVWAEQGAERLTELAADDDRIGELTAERDALRSELSGLPRRSPTPVLRRPTDSPAP